MEKADETKTSVKLVDNDDRDTPRLVADNQGLVVRNIGKSFKKRPVLREVSLSVQRGE
ncbi:MAG: lipopolysaccharide export system ATP-binding protein, partial [Alphaproteobacteria bacterium]